MLTVTGTYKVKVKALTQGKDHDVNIATEQQRHTPLCAHSGKLKVGEGAPE
jgi:hypothetical protein